MDKGHYQNLFKKLIPADLINILKKSGVSKPTELLVFSVTDLKKLTKLSHEDILYLKSLVADNLCLSSVPGFKLLTDKYLNTPVSTGCQGINNLLCGGFRRGTLTELYGESGSGKTQVALHAALENWSEGCIYICTEDLFPVKRFNQIKMNLPFYDSNIDYSNNIFIEHAFESNDIITCVKIKIRRLLQSRKIQLVVIDSVAASYRTESTNFIERAKELRILGLSLISLAQEHNFAVLCINQVSGSFNPSSDVLPCLGLAWSNMMSTRLCLRKTKEIITINDIGNVPENMQIKCVVRELQIVVSSHLPNKSLKIAVTPKGIVNL